MHLFGERPVYGSSACWLICGEHVVGSLKLLILSAVVGSCRFTTAATCLGKPPTAMLSQAIFAQIIASFDLESRT